MISSLKFIFLVAPLLSLLLPTLVNTSPLDLPAEADDALVILKRQAVDPTGVEPEDESDTEIAADGTGPLRSAVNARSLYLDQSTATWYQIDVASDDAAASFTKFVETTETPIPPPSDPRQTSGPNPWNVDHIFELQVIGEAFKSDRPTTNPTSIAAADWKAVTNAVFTLSPACTAIAEEVTVLKNLEGIPNSVNTFKKQVFTGNLTGVGYPSTGGTATYFSFFGPAVQKYLEANQQDFFSTNGIVDNIGDALSSAGNNNAAIKEYFTSYALLHYQGAIDYLSTWSGKSIDRTTKTSAATAKAPATTTALACTLRDEVVGGGKDPEILHLCNCNDGSHPKATVTGDEYACPAQVSVIAKRSWWNDIELGNFGP